MGEDNIANPRLTAKIIERELLKVLPAQTGLKVHRWMVVPLMYRLSP